MTSGDFLEGHKDIGQFMLVEANNNTPKTAYLLACERFVLQFKPANFRFKIMSRSNCSYSIKVLVRTFICDIEKDVVH